MHHAARVGMRQGFGDLKRVTRRFGKRQRPALLHQHPNVDPLDEFEGDEMDPAVLADIMHPSDVFVVQPGGGLGFVLKTLHGFGVGRLLGRKHFQGDDAGQPRVGRAEDAPHAAAAHVIQEFEMPEVVAGHDPAFQYPMRRIGGGGRRQRGMAGNDRGLIAHDRHRFRRGRQWNSSARRNRLPASKSRL